jgi:glycerol-3-phosphate acyltransferase PlsY
VVVAVTRAVSLASIVAAVLAPVLLWLFSYPQPVIAGGLVLALLVIIRHRDNIRRLTSGAEPKFKVNSQ